MIVRFLLLFTMLGAAFVARAQTIHIEMSRAQVEAILGKPKAEMTRTGYAVLIYDEGATVELENDRVIHARGIDLSFQPYNRVASVKAAPEQPVQVQPPPAPESAPAATPAEPAVKETTVQSPYGLPEGYDEEHYELSDEEAMAFMKDLVASEMDLTDKEASFLLGPDPQSEEEAAMSRFVNLILVFVISTVLMLVIVKVAFHMAGISLFTTQALVISSIYGLIEMGLASVEWGSEWRSTFFVDSILSFIVLNLLILGLSPVKKAQTAIKISLGCYAVSYGLSYVLFLLLIYLI